MTKKIFKNEKSRKAAYEVVFGSPEGRKVLHDMMLEAHVLNPVFNPDPYITAFNDGNRNAVLRVTTILAYSPNDFLNVTQEIKDETEQ